MPELVKKFPSNTPVMVVTADELAGPLAGLIPQLSADPVAPAAQTAWVLRTVAPGAGGGKINCFLGLGFPYLTVGVGGVNTYQFSYRTIEGTTLRANLT